MTYLQSERWCMFYNILLDQDMTGSIFIEHNVYVFFYFNVLPQIRWAMYPKYMQTHSNIVFTLECFPFSNRFSVPCVLCTHYMKDSEIKCLHGQLSGVTGLSCCWWYIYTYQHKALSGCSATVKPHIRMPWHKSRNKTLKLIQQRLLLRTGCDIKMFIAIFISLIPNYPCSRFNGSWNKLSVVSNHRLYCFMYMYLPIHASNSSLV